MRWIRSLSVAAVLVATSVFGQVLTVDSRSAQQLTGLEATEKIGDSLFVLGTATVKLRPVILVEATTEAANVVFDASDKDRVPVAFEQLTDRIIAISTGGKVWVDVTAIDFSKNLYGRSLHLVQLDAPVPPDDDDEDDPPQPPDPDIGNDYGVGLVAYQNSPKANPKSVAALYRSAADMLYGRPRAMTVDQTLKYLDTEIAKVALQGDPEGWKVWLATMDLALLESQRKRPAGYTRQDWYGAYYEIAKALEAVK